MKTFVLTEDHLKLLAAAYVSWEDCEYGAPAINCKRPDGNSSVEADIAEILGWPSNECPHCGEELGSPEWRERAAKLHKETETALQVVLATQSFTPGTYQCADYSRSWEVSS